MMMSLTQAAQATGKSKSTLLRSIRTGKISASRDESGAFMIDAAELSRVFSVTVDALYDAPMARHDTADDAAILRVEVALLRDQLDREREFSRQLSSLLGEEREERRKLTAMLTHQSESMTRQTAPGPRRERRWATWVPAGILLAMLTYVAYTVIVNREAIILAPAEEPQPAQPQEQPKHLWEPPGST